MGLVPNHEFMRINIKATQVFLMLKLSYTKNGVMLFITGFPACPTRIGRLKLALHRPIWDLGQRSHVHILFLIPFFSQSLRGANRVSQNFHPTFKVGSDTQRVNKLSIESFFKEGSNPRFRPDLRDFVDKSLGP